MNRFIDLAVMLPALLFGLATQEWVRLAMRRADEAPSS